MTNLNEKLNEQLEFFVKAACDEYKLFSSDYYRLQLARIRTYLWLSSILIAAQFTFFSNLLEGKYWPFTRVVRENFQYNYVFICITMILSVVSFAIAIDTFRGRRLHRSPIGNLDAISKHLLERKSESDRESIYYTALQGYKEAISSRVAEINFIGRRLRLISFILLCSFFNGIIAFFLEIIENYICK